MTFTEHAWDAIGGIRKVIDNHPFLTGLADGSLPEEKFRYYMAQDALYLKGYAKSLAVCGSQADDSGDAFFWITSAAGAISVERELHGQFVDDLDAAEKSPACTAYTSYLAALGTTGSYPCLAAGLLPCFWIYQDVGSRLVDTAGDLDAHPYGRWIETYTDPAFTESTRQAREIVDRVAATATGTEQARMLEVFLTCSRYEAMFWEAAWSMQTWPV